MRYFLTKEIINKIRMLILIILVFLLIGCINGKPLIEKEKTIENMTLREKIGQMLIGYYYSDYVDEVLIKSLKENQPGGFILVKNNITTYENSKKFVDDMNKIVDIPMFITIDHEGGNVQKFNSITDYKVAKLPSLNKVGELNSLDLAYGIGKIIGEETRTIGINAVYAPVLDVGSLEKSAMKNRIISSSADIVSELGYQIGKGIEDSGVLAVYKHFPGIGGTEIDTHHELPIINKTKEEWYETDAKPFIKVINEGARMMMIGHVNYPLITNDKLPASLSKVIITDILRNELKYQGLVLIDAINMLALKNTFSEREIYKLGINAGVDIFIMPRNLKSAIDIIEDLVNDGEVLEETIDQAVERILKIKKEKIYNFTNLSSDYLNNQEHQDILKKYNLYSN